MATPIRSQPAQPPLGQDRAASRLQAHDQTSRKPARRPRVQRETIRLAGLHRDAAVAEIGHAVARAGRRDFEPQETRVVAMDRSLLGQTPRAPRRAALLLAPGVQPHAMLEGTVLHQLGIQPAVGGIVDVLKKKAVHGRAHRRPRSGEIHRPADLGLRTKRSGEQGKNGQQTGRGDEMFHGDRKWVKIKDGIQHQRGLARASTFAD